MIIGWLKGLWKRPGLRPESQWKLTFDGDILEGVDQTGRKFSSRIEDVCSIKVETNDSGPCGADVWFLMFDREDRLKFGFPQGATGVGPIIDWILTLDGCDHREFSRAMGSTHNALFHVWGRAG